MKTFTVTLIFARSRWYACCTAKRCPFQRHSAMATKANRWLTVCNIIIASLSRDLNSRPFPHKMFVPISQQA